MNYSIKSIHIQSYHRYYTPTIHIYIYIYIFRNNQIAFIHVCLQMLILAPFCWEGHHSNKTPLGVLFKPTGVHSKTEKTSSIQLAIPCLQVTSICYLWYLLFVICYLLFVICYLLFVVICYLLFVACSPFMKYAMRLVKHLYSY